MTRTFRVFNLPTASPHQADCSLNTVTTFTLPRPIVTWNL